MDFAFFKSFVGAYKAFGSNPAVVGFLIAVSLPELLYSGESFKRFMSDLLTPSSDLNSENPRRVHGLRPVKSNKLSANAFPI